MVQVDSATVWGLFLSTMLIHVVTFHFLEYIANTFREYLTLSVLDGSAHVTSGNNAKDHILVPLVPPKTPGSESNVNSYNIAVSSQVHYKPLHDTLDVSVFR